MLEKGRRCRVCQAGPPWQDFFLGPGHQVLGQLLRAPGQWSLNLAPFGQQLPEYDHRYLALGLLGRLV